MQYDDDATTGDVALKVLDEIVALAQQAKTALVKRQKNRYEVCMLQITRKAAVWGEYDGLLAPRGTIQWSD